MPRRYELMLVTLVEKPFDEGNPPAGPAVHWVKPKLVAEIAFAEWTRHGLLRQPRFVGLRIDKNPTDVHRETAAAGTSRKRSDGRHATR